MKKIYTLIFGASMFFVANAGVSVGDPVILGSVKQVNNTIHNNPAQLIINDHVRYSTIVTHINDDFISGSLKDYPGSHFNLSVDNGKLSGFVVISNDLVYEYTTNAQNEVVVQQVSLEDMICTDYGKDDIIENQKQNFVSTIENQVLSGSASGPVPEYQSRPGSQYVLYLDFDGHTLASNNYWVINNSAPTTTASAGYTDTQMWQTWSVVSEDFAPFDVNVTTDSTVFNNAAAGKKMRVALTTTSSWKPGAGGVTVNNIFPKTNISYYHPAWVFVDKVGNAKNAGECASHEFAHTLSLHHDGTALVVQAPGDTLSYASTYYRGHGNWAPIMGASYNKALSHFSKGEYNYANNTSEDDISLINGYLPFVEDAHGDDMANATELTFTLDGADGIVDSASNNGIINDVADFDVFHFYTGGEDTLTLKVTPSASLKTNLDVEVKLYNSSSTLVGTFNTSHDSYTIKGITISQQLPPDSYFITVDGTGSGSPITGWSDYNSMGPYYITGTIPNADQATKIAAANSKNTHIYPNPIGTNNILYFAGTVDNVKVHDLTGQIINTASKTSQINLGSDVSEGIYFVEYTSDGERILSKVIK